MADLRPQYTEEAIGANHPTKLDVINRAWNIQHDEDGTHKGMKKVMFVPFTHGIGSARFVSGYATGWDMDVVTDTCYASGALPSYFGSVVSVKLCWNGVGAGTYQPGIKVQVSGDNEAETTHTSTSTTIEGVYANDRTFIRTMAATAFADASAGDSFGIQGFLNAFTDGGGCFTGVIIEYVTI